MSRNLEFAAYPTLGEGLRFMIAAFDLRHYGDKQELKRLDRMAREGDFNAGLFDRLVSSLILKPLTDLGDPELGAFLAWFIRERRIHYAKLLGAVSADGLTRDQLKPILAQYYLPRAIADFLIDATLDGIMLEPELLLADPLHIGQRQRVSPIRVVLEEHLWQQGRFGTSVLDSLQEGGRGAGSRERDKVRDWLLGEHIPDVSHLLLFAATGLGKQGATPRVNDHAHRRLARRLRIARAVEYCLAAFPEQDLATHTRALLRPDAAVPDIGTAVYNAVVNQASEWEGLSELGLRTFALLSFEWPMDEAERAQGKVLLEQFERRADELGVPWATEWMVRWCKARLAIWQGDWEQGLRLYDRALKAALYRAGPESGRVFREALAIATRMKKKTAVNWYVEQGNALNLWPRVLKGVDINAGDGEVLSKILVHTYLPHLPDLSAKAPAS